MPSTNAYAKLPRRRSTPLSVVADLKCSFGSGSPVASSQFELKATGNGLGGAHRGTLGYMYKPGFLHSVMLLADLLKFQARVWVPGRGNLHPLPTLAIEMGAHSYIAGF